MQIKIGNSLFLGGASKYKIEAPVSGLESPAIRTGSGLYAGRDGGFVSGHFYGHRTIVIKGFYIGEDCADADELRQDLFGLLRIRYKLPIFIQTFSGDIYFTEGFVTDIKADIESPVAGEYQVTLLCPDPILYEAENMTSSASTWKTKSISANTPTDVNNTGNVDILPYFTFSGATTNPTMTNNTTGETFSLNASIPAGLVVDMKKRLTLADNTSYNEKRTTDSTWWALTPGINSITLSAAGVMSYQKGKAGI